ncbi:MAG: flagellar biosynthesis protein [Proteobacteria bacterium]|nr:flagellar biosynthesis protein [Pseudomonadota bacterium]
MTSSKAPPRATPYSRFIPREELADFAAWQPGAVHAPAKPSAEPAPPPPPTPEELLAKVPARLTAARDAGYHDGHRDGLAALDAAKRQFALHTSAQMQQLMASWSVQLDALEAQMALAVTDVAMRLARQVLRSELTQTPEHVTTVAREAVAAVMLSARHLRVALHPDDLPLVQAGAETDLAARGVVLHADGSLARGGCVVSSDIGQVDARIEPRWQQAAQAMGSALPWMGEAEEAAP